MAAVSSRGPAAVVPRTPRRALGRRLLVVTGLLLSALMTLSMADVAQAHAELLATDPADGAVLDKAPQTVTLTFNEQVTVAPGTVRLFAATGEPVELDARARGSTVVITMPEPVPEGAYTVAWRVTSADSHPVSGALPFTVGHGDGDVLDVPSDSDAALGVQRVLKAVHYAGLLLLVGLTAFRRLVARPGQLAVPTTRWLLRTAAGLAVIGSALLVPVTAMAILGRPLAAALAPGEWAAGLSGASIAVFVLTAAGSGGVLLLRDGGRNRPSGWLLAVPVLMLLTAPVLTGHSMLTGPRAVMVAADMLHVVAAAVWLGGTVGLVVLLAQRGTGGAQRAAGAVRRFSDLAAWSVGALSLSGVVLALLIVPQWDALVVTNYGRALLTKIGLVGTTLALAWWNRTRLLPAVEEQPAGPEWSALRRIVAYEAAILVLALAVTAALVTFDPRHRGRDHSGSQPVAASSQWQAEADELRLAGQLTGTRLSFAVTTATGDPVEPIEAPVIGASLPAADLGPLAIETYHVGDGRYEAELSVPLAGRWELDIPVRTGTFAAPVASVTIEITEAAENAGAVPPES